MDGLDNCEFRNSLDIFAKQISLIEFFSVMIINASVYKRIFLTVKAAN